MFADHDSFAEIVVISEVSGSLTKSERAVLRGLEEAIKRYEDPSLAEIVECSGPGIYQSGVHMYLRQLAQKGYVQLPPPRRARGVRLLKGVPSETEI